MINIDESKQIYKSGEVDDAKASVIDAVNVDPSRMMALTDGIFGMVMTLLIFSIEVPDINFANYIAFNTFLETLITNNKSLRSLFHTCRSILLIPS